MFRLKRVGVRRWHAGTTAWKLDAWQSTSVFFFFYFFWPSVTPSQPSPIFSSSLASALLEALAATLQKALASAAAVEEASGQHMFIAFIASLALLCRRTLCLADFGSLTLVDSSSGRPHTGSSSHGSRPILELWSDTVMSYPHPWYYVSICIHVSGFWDVAVVEWLAKVPATWDVSRLCVLHGCSFIMSM